MDPNRSQAPLLVTRPLTPQQLAWLRTELSDWTAEGLITDDQAQRISTRYRADLHTRLGVGRVLLGLGACFVGVGLIWLVAANLDELPPLGRFGLVAGLWLAFLAGGEAMAARRVSAPVVGAVRLLAALGAGAVVFQAAQSLQVPGYEPRLVGVWAAAALLHAYLVRAYLPFVVGVATGVAWWFMQPLWGGADATTTILLLGAGAVLAAGLAVLHDERLTSFAWTWRTVAGAMALLALFVAAVPGVGDDDGVRWSTWLVVVLVAAGAAAAAGAARALRSAAGPRAALEPLGAVGVTVAALALAAWTTSTDTTDVGVEDWLHAAVSVTAYVVLAVGLIALGTVREHPPLTWMAAVGLVVFTTFQGFAVFAPIVTGAWLFVVLGTLFLATGFLVDRARRGLAEVLDTDDPAGADHTKGSDR